MGRPTKHLPKERNEKFLVKFQTFFRAQERCEGHFFARSGALQSGFSLMKKVKTLKHKFQALIRISHSLSTHLLTFVIASIICNRRREDTLFRFKMNIKRMNLFDGSEILVGEDRTNWISSTKLRQY